MVFEDLFDLEVSQNLLDVREDDLVDHPEVLGKQGLDHVDDVLLLVLPLEACADPP